MVDKKQLRGGLNLVPKDPRNFKLGAVFTLPKLSELPENFSLVEVKIKDQTARNPNNDKCSAYSSTTSSSRQEGVDLNPDYTFAVAKEISKDYDGFGLTLIDVLKANVNVGAIEQKDVPKDIDVEDPKYRRLENWPIHLKSLAITHSKESFFEITGPYDHFDNIRASLWKFREKNQSVLLGVIWGWDQSDVYIETIPYNGPGHALDCPAFERVNEKDYLKIQNSWGKDAGKNGYQYFSREVINHNVEKYGAYMMVDIPREKAEWMIKNGIKDRDSWIISTMKTLLNALTDLVTLKFLEINNPKNEKKVIKEIDNRIEENKKIIEINEEILKENKKPMDLSLKTYECALSKIGKDASPRDLAPDNLACADSVSNILKEVLGDFPIIVSTVILYQKLQSDDRFIKVTVPIMGDIVISPTGMGNGRVKHGHVGIMGLDEKIMSNNPLNGKFDDRMTLTYWKNYLGSQGGYPVYYFRVLG